MNVDYTDISKDYDRYRSYPQSLIETIIELGKIKEGMKLLDLGCGTGNVASQLLQQVNADVICIDRSLPMLQVAREKSLDIICANADNNRMPFHDGSFDTILGAYVIHQIKNLKFLFSECYRILRSSALVLLTSSHRQIENQHPVVSEFFPNCIDIDKARFPDIGRIDTLLHSAGFVDIRHSEGLFESIPIDNEHLQKVKGKYVSTYHLLPQSEFELGVKKLEAFIKSRSQPELREWRYTLIFGRKNG